MPNSSVVFDSCATAWKRFFKPVWLNFSKSSEGRKDGAVQRLICGASLVWHRLRKVSGVRLSCISRLVVALRSCATMSAWPTNVSRRADIALVYT